MGRGVIVFAAFFAALGQVPDPRFLRVVLQGVALALGLLVAIYLAFLGLIEWWVPGQITLPFFGPIGGLGWAAGIGSALLMLAVSVFLMVPVASAFSALFLEQVAEAVEAVHYPGQQAHPLGFVASLAEGAGLLALMLVVNLVALAFSFVLGPFGPVLFWVVNGWLLGREYFLMAALRHMGRSEARALMRANMGQIWLAGTLMAAPLTLPLISLFVPVLGAATFTHLFQRLR
ncbi:hypothetical protein GC209_16565 [bacterium]|nr:hypothetical protein [bacterium]